MCQLQFSFNHSYYLGSKSELSQLVRDVSDRNDRVVIESDGEPIVAMVRYDYLAGLLEALEDAKKSLAE